MPKLHPPAFKEPSFDCPHCGAYAQQRWAEVFMRYEDSGGSFDPPFTASVCFSCSRLAVWRSFQRTQPGTGIPITVSEIVWPATKWSGPRPHADMPDEVKAIYTEAANVAAASPRSASALLRLSLEALLTDLYPDGNLNAKIGAAVSDGLPVGVQQTLDVIRFNGNQSVHELHVEDSPEIATTLFQLLNYVVEEMISRPRQLDALYGGLPDGVREAVARRDGGDS